MYRVNKFVNTNQHKEQIEFNFESLVNNDPELNKKYFETEHLEWVQLARAKGDNHE